MNASSQAVATRDRILDAAMHLFGENGFGGTSVAEIERAAGLTPGAGGLYHHFRSKDSLLAEGIDRHLGRLGALRDIRRLFRGIGEPRAELTLIARYVLNELDAEAELLRVLVAESRARPALVAGPVEMLVEGTYAEFAGWLEDTAELPPSTARTLSAVALGALVSHRLLSGLLPAAAAAGPDDDTFIAAWVDLVAAALPGYRAT